MGATAAPDIRICLAWRFNLALSNERHCQRKRVSHSAHHANYLMAQRGTDLPGTVLAIFPMLRRSDTRSAAGNFVGLSVWSMGSARCLMRMNTLQLLSGDVYASASGLA